MERESFENEEIAALMNDNFVNIKVDREERPDLDEIYMNAVQILTGRGGWPMTVFLTPEGKPFYGGTYFPPEDRHGMPGFPKVLQAVAHAYRERPGDVEKSVGQILAVLSRLGETRETQRPFSTDLLQAAAEQIGQAYDSEYGGFGRAPKFPNTGVFELFLRAYRKSQERRLLEMVDHTLVRMAQGGIYDYLGGGFHRYSVDEKWLVPHFEKMLYDNAQLLRIYADAFRVTGRPLFRQVVRETADYLLREMLHPDGGFYSTQDADSEGEEGKFFVWTEREVLEILGEEDGEIFCRIYDVTEFGNFEEKSILHPVLELEQAARLFKKDVAAIERIVSEAKTKLFNEREKRIKPFRDEKVLTSWNGLVLSGLAGAYEITGEHRYGEAAERTVEFLFSKMFQKGLLLHSYKDGTAKLLGYLDDYSFAIAGLIDLFEALQDRSFLERAATLAETMIREFWDDVDGGFFYTGRSHEQLISRSKTSYDSSVPSGSSMAAQALLRLYHYLGKEDYLKRGEKILRLYYDAMEQQPFGFAHMLAALDFYLEKPKEIVVVGEAGDPRFEEIVEKLRSFYLPNKTMHLAEPGKPLQELSPMLQGKGQIDGKPTVYVCHNFTCSQPVTEWEQVEGLLKS
jgi:uncharacterized protein YyaL (SSP411 family)